MIEDAQDYLDSLDIDGPGTLTEARAESVLYLRDFADVMAGLGEECHEPIYTNGRCQLVGRLFTPFGTSYDVVTEEVVFEKGEAIPFDRLSSDLASCIIERWSSWEREKYGHAVYQSVVARWMYSYFDDPNEGIRYSNMVRVDSDRGFWSDRWVEKYLSD
ncbi:MAG: hypothetical protein ABEN55_04055 [Bradymonadaceae bacterium]